MHRASQILRTCCSNLSAWQRGGFVLPNQHIPIGRSTELPSFLTEGDNFRILCSNVHLTPAFQHVSCNLQPERNLQRLQPLEHKRHVRNLREETCRILEAGSASRLTVAIRQPPALQKADSLQVSYVVALKLLFPKNFFSIDLLKLLFTQHSHSAWVIKQY